MYSQVKFRILTSKGKIMEAIKVNKENRNYIITKVDGEILKMKKSKIIYIDDILPDWEYFKYNYKDGLKKRYLVVNIDSTIKEKIYRLTKNWIKDTYKNPEKVLKADFENKKVRIDGYDSKGVRFFNPLAGSSFEGSKYSVEISFKDNKYKFTPISMTAEISLNSFNFPLNEHVKNFIYRKNGEPWSSNKYYPSNIEDLFNNLNISLNNYIKMNIKKDKNAGEDNDW